MRGRMREESRGRLQVSNSVYIPPVKADCSVILTGGLAGEWLIGSLYLPGHFMYAHPKPRAGAQRLIQKAGGNAHQ